MTGPTTIRAIEARPLDIQLSTPFGISGGSMAVANNVLVIVELADGTRGLGEGAPFPAFNGETQQGVLSAIDAVRSEVIGRDARTWKAIAATLGASGTTGSARCAIETGILDALARRAGIPLWAWFGGARPTLTTDMTVTTGSIEDAARDARAIADRGIRTIKVKVGSGDAELDQTRVLRIAQAAPGSRLLLDGNAGMSVDAAVELILGLRAREVEVELFEQPVAADDWRGLRQVSERAEVVVIADESAADARAALRLLEEGAVQGLNIKLMKCGVAEALEIAAIAQVFEAKLMIGGMVESSLAMSMSACLAAGLGHFHWADLDTPLFMIDPPFEGGFSLRGETIEVGVIEAGHGVTLRAS